jgi:phage protein D
MTAAAPNVDVLIKGKEVPDSDFVSYLVERDMNQPDVAAILLSNQNDIYNAIAIGDPVEVKINESDSIYKGEVLGLEPSYRGGEPTMMLVRCANQMHRLTRKRKSVTFTEKSDQQILDQVVKDAGLTLEWEHKKSITYKHVYQHNQTNLEFVRVRAARLGCNVWCVDTKLFVKEPKLDDTSKIFYSVEEGGDLRSFTPRMSSAQIVNKVTVKGWNPETKELITGTATAEKSKLGQTNAVTACKAIGANEETFTHDHPIWSKEEADVLAAARLRDLNLTFITAEAECAPNPLVDLGQTVQIEANGLTADPFNGHYFVVGITHRHILPKGNEGGMSTTLRLLRDAMTFPPKK